jgi:hypothetical protein
MQKIQAILQRIAESETDLNLSNGGLSTLTPKTSTWRSKTTTP